MNTKDVLMVNAALKPFYIMILLGFLLLVQATSAVPNTGAATAIGSNNFTVAITMSDGGDTWVVWGGAAGNELFGSQVQTGDCSLTVYGAPLIGGQTIWYRACDSTGCGNERTLTLPAITPLPTPTFGNAYKNLTARHFAIDSIAPNILPGYTATGITPTLLWGIMFFFILFGFWFRTKSVRMVLIIGLLMATFILTPTAGLFLGAPLMFQYVAQGLMAAAMAGILISFIRK
jgi:hypothetical protein